MTTKRPAGPRRLIRTAENLARTLPNVDAEPGTNEWRVQDDARDDALKAAGAKIAKLAANDYDRVQAAVDECIASRLNQADRRIMMVLLAGRGHIERLAWTTEDLAREAARLVCIDALFDTFNPDRATRNYRSQNRESLTLARAELDTMHARADAILAELISSAG